MEWIGAWFVIGAGLLAILWKWMKIDWNSEATDTKLLLIAMPIGWPLVLLLIGYVWAFKK